MVYADGLHHMKLETEFFSHVFEQVDISQALVPKGVIITDDQFFDPDFF